MNAMNNFKDVIEQWPSPADLANDLGTSIHVVRKWHFRDRIPSKKWAALIAAAKTRHIKISAQMLTEFSSRCGKKKAA